ncbi:unnamed protein product [Cyclocybe aegerita]|uniref:Uncharacterized protein n=1 Tax=Cyclocybe aegerita TaxID=1973307 RepID=A0A8S0XPL4_CYCAE|nr:unnamed protein product [Cyclocybe aegerita]
MFSCSNHHHLGQQSSSVPLLAGTHRRRSPDKTPSESSDDAQAAPLTKSPHTWRVVKRGRTDRNDQPQHHVPWPSTPLLLSPFTNPSTMGPLKTGCEKPTKTNNLRPPQDDLKHLEQLLDSVLATAIILQATSTKLVELSPHTRSALAAIVSMLQPSGIMPTITKPQPQPVVKRPAAATGTKSYAQAALHKAGMDQPSHRKGVSQAGRAPHMSWKAQPTQMQCHSPYRLTLRWPNRQPPLTMEFLSLLVPQLNYNLNDVHQPPRILAANLTKAGNISLLTWAPYTAAQLIT